MIQDEDRRNEDWPDKGLLETALRNWLKDPSIIVKEFRSRIATNEGDNYTSNMYRVTAKCEDSEETIGIIIKRLIGSQAIMETTAFSREEHILRCILPEMHAALRKVIPDVEPFGASFVYATPGVLMMEDLQRTGFHMAKRQLSLDLDHCSLVVNFLARYHAASVFLMERQSIELSLFGKSIHAEQPHVMDRYCSSMLKGLSNALEAYDNLRKYSTKISAIAEQLSFRMMLDLDDHKDDEFLVLAHGDLWMNNMMFRYSPSGKPDGVRLVDFQLSSITNPCIDLQLFLNSSTNHTVRTTCIDQLVEEYHETLCRTMKALGCSTETPTIEKLKKDYDNRPYFGMFATFGVLPVVLSEPGQFDFTDVVKTGKPQIEIFRNNSFRKAMEWFLPLFESKGFL